MPTHPGRDPLTPGRIGSAKEILRLGLTTLTNKHHAIQARRRVADFLNLAVTALTVDTENHDGDGAPTLAGKILDGLVGAQP